MIYVLTMWNAAQSQSELFLNGPFDSEDNAATWGRDWGISNEDCPMWQVVDIESANLPVRSVEREPS